MKTSSRHFVVSGILWGLIFALFISPIILSYSSFLVGALSSLKVVPGADISGVYFSLFWTSYVLHFGNVNLSITDYSKIVDIGLPILLISLLCGWIVGKALEKIFQRRVVVAGEELKKRNGFLLLTVLALLVFLIIFIYSFFAESNKFKEASKKEDSLVLNRVGIEKVITTESYDIKSVAISKDLKGNLLAHLQIIDNSNRSYLLESSIWMDRGPRIFQREDKLQWTSAVATQDIMIDYNQQDLINTFNTMRYAAPVSTYGPVRGLTLKFVLTPLPTDSEFRLMGDEYSNYTLDLQALIFPVNLKRSYELTLPEKFYISSNGRIEIK